MSLEEILAKRKQLKKSSTVDKSRSFLDNYEANTSFSKEYIDRFFEVNMENWYEKTKEFTPRTVFLDMNKEVIKELHSSHVEYGKFLKEEFKELEDLEVLEVFEKTKIWMEERMKKVFEENEPFKKFFDTLTNIIQTEFDGKSVFCKTSSRSPKDVRMNSHTFFSAEMEKQIKEKKIREIQDDLERKFKLYELINQIGTNFLKCGSAFDVIELFIRSNRVQEDFETFIFEKIRSVDKFFLVLREWDESIDPDFEFRCFVHKGKMNAISEYNFLTPNKLIIKYKQEMLDLMRKTFAALHERLDIESYVIDFAIRNDIERLFSGQVSEEEKNSIQWCIFIELNPFQFSTGSCMFDWNIDKEVIEGRKEFEFRIQTNFDKEKFLQILHENVGERYKKYFFM